MRMVAEHKKRELLGQFVEYLKSRGIGAEMRQIGSVWGLWVHNEDACPEVKQEFRQFLHDPAAPRYMVAPEPALNPQPIAQSAPARDMLKSTMTRLSAFCAQRRGFLRGPIPVTNILMALSIAVTLPYLLGMPIGNYLAYLLRGDNRLATQWWRLLTPAFVHSNTNLLHIVFNMLWLRELGGRIERIKGPGFMLTFFVVSAGVSNFAQYVASPAVSFGGMSGVVYGLFGYIWIKSRIAPEQGFQIDQGTVMMLMLWFFLGWSGIMPIANWAHGFGLVSGIAIAVAPERRRKPTHDPLGE